jgi:hypothetical protein
MDSRKIKTEFSAFKGVLGMYQKNSMYEHVVRLSRYHRMMWWTQDETFGPQNNPNFWRELNEFCWLVYSKAFDSKGPAYLGRLADLQKIWIDVCNIRPSGLGLLDSHTKGNALEILKWAPVLNDAWVLGHIHRRAEFILVSPRSPHNLWEDSSFRTGVTITGRELLGLKEFGYVQKNGVSGYGIFYCNNIYKARNADLVKYSELMDRPENKSMNGIMRFMGLNKSLIESIKNHRRPA